jgi:hypothetical protein
MNKNKELSKTVTSSEKNRRLEKLEDILYGKTAKLAIQEGFSSKEETEDLLNSI